MNIRVMVAEEDVGDRLRRDIQLAQWVEDQRARPHHARVGDDQRLAVPNQDDGRGDPVTRVASVEEMHGRHGGRCYAVAPGGIRPRRTVRRGRLGR